MKPDYAHTLTDKKIAELEKKLQKEYSQAVKDIEKKMIDYMRRFEKKEKAWQRWVMEGKKTNAEYIQWRKGQMVAGRRWGQLKDKLAKDCSNVNQIARGIINGDVAGVYALNMNYATFQIEKGLGVNTSFSQYSQETVERMMAQNPDMLPPPGKKVSARIRQGKDVRWNKKTIQSVATQGIIQGESIPVIAHRLAYAVGDRNYKAAIRNARTMCTGAQNAGRIDAHDRARAMGCRIDDYWMAVHDNRTRSSHRELDMEKRGEDGYFSNGCRFPGDPECDDQSEIWNCRCTILGIPTGFEEGYGIDADPDIMGMSYDEWLKAKPVSKPILSQVKKSKAIKQRYINEYRRR